MQDAPFLTPASGANFARVWHGWTTDKNADAYETLLKTEIFPGSAATKR